MQFSLKTILCLLTLFLSTSANAKNQYCRANGDHYEVIYLVQKGVSESELNSHKSALRSVVEGFNVGDKVDFSILTKNGRETILSTCRPGCPETSGLDQIFGLGDCAAQIAKKDQNNFDRKIPISFSKYLSVAQSADKGVGDIFQALSAISRSSTSSANKKIILSSLLPNMKKSEISSSSMDEVFVRSVQESKIPEKMPDFVYTGVIQNSNLIKFWKDIFLVRGQEFQTR